MVYLEFVNNFEKAKNRIVSIFPDLNNSNFVEINVGWQNYIVQADDKLIFRFPRDLEALNSLRIEINLLNTITKIIHSSMSVPNYIYYDFNNEPFGCYNKLHGKMYSYDEFIKLEHLEKVNYLRKVRDFLKILNLVDYSAININLFDSKDYYKKLYSNITKECYYLFDEKLKKSTDDLFISFLNDENNNYSPSLIHGDLKLNHILINETNIGIIDFGNIKLFDPMYDYTWIYGIDKSVLEEFDFTEDEIKRLNFYSKVVPYYQIIYGVKNKSSEKIKSGFNMIYKDYKK